MNCPNCPAPLVCPEGANAYCTECGWGRTPAGRISDGVALKSIEHPPGGIERAAAFARSLTGLQARIRDLEKRVAELDGWTPTAENINALPPALKQYVYLLETNADPAGTIRQNVLTQDENATLRKRVGELIDAILTHRRDTPPGASAIDQKLWKEVL